MNQSKNESSSAGQEIVPVDGAADTPIDSTSDSSPETNGRPTIFKSMLRGLNKLAGGNGSARDTLEELIEERDEGEVPLDSDERLLLANILALRTVTIYDVMVPRADIVSIPCTASLQEVIKKATEEGHSRLPVYTDSLDDAQGMVHIKDVVRWRGKDDTFKIADIQRKLLFVAPSMRVLELLLEMRVKRSHMALVVDEFGGVDGLVTIEDLVEEIVGEIEDEHDRSDEPKLEKYRDGSWVADARVEIETLEDRFGEFVNEDEREQLDTLGGLVFALVGRVPIRGEIIAYNDNIEFEILDADPRRIHSIRVRRPVGGTTSQQPAED